MNLRSRPAPAATTASICLPESILDRVRVQARAIAVRTRTKGVTYRELNENANRFAKSLLNAGVSPDTVVGVFMNRSPETLAALIGIWKVGAAYLALDPITPPERLAFILQDGEVPLILTGQTLAPCLPPHKSRLLYAEDTLSAYSPPAENIQVEISGTSLAYVLYTSGSTGRPKGVEICHGGLANVVIALADELNLRPREVTLAHTSLSFDVSNLELYLPLVSGGVLYIADSGPVGDGARLIQLLKESNATTMLGTSTLWRLLVDAGWSGKSDLRVISGGEVLPLELALDLSRRAAEVWNQYGPSEATICSTTERIEPTATKVTIGRPLRNVAVHILDSSLRPVHAGAIGELYVGGPGVARGYRNRPELNRTAFLDDPFAPGPGGRIYRTGDLASKFQDGRLEFHGRIDRQVKIHGHRIELEEIENHLCQFPEVSAAAVSVLDGHRLIAWFASRGAIHSPAIREFLRKRLPSYMIPSEFRRIESMPLTDSGKIDRKSLEQQAFQTAPGTISEPAGNVEKRLRSIWELLLHARPIPIDESFFDLGGDSLLAALLVTQVKKNFGTRISPDALLECPTIRTLAVRIQAQEKGAMSSSSFVPLRAQGSLPPLFIVHGLGGSALLFRSLSACLPDDQPVFCITLPSGRVNNISEVAIETLAARYIEEMRLVNPIGPYNIAGHSFGALVAFEIAVQLGRTGEVPGLLALIEADRHLTGDKSPEEVAMGHMLRLYQAKIKSLADKGITEVVKRRVEHMKLKHRVRLAENAVDDPETSHKTLEAKELLVLQSRRYQPTPYKGKALLLRARDEVRGQANGDLGWAGLIGEGLEIVDIPGAHLTIFDEPNVSTLASELNERLRESYRLGFQPFGS